MTFLEFYSNHFASLTCIFVVLGIISISLIIFLISHILKTKNVKTPWFEIAPDSIKLPESEEMGKTRLLLRRQFEYIDNFINGVQPILLAVTKEIVDDAMNVLFGEPSRPKTHIQTCLIQSATGELIKDLKNYLNSLLIMNHIGTNRDKITKYAKGHTCQIVGIAKKSYCDTFCKLSGQICTTVEKYWQKVGITDPTQWAEDKLIELLLDLSELRYSDFDRTSTEEK